MAKEQKDVTNIKQLWEVEICGADTSKSLSQKEEKL